MIGTKLGPYEITAKLGEGGMGVVYKAKDFHLGRDVALKVLPESLAQDPDRLARFEREAKLLAQLNHPNIAQIYGFEASGETRALVMELVEGPTLAERLEFGDSHQFPSVAPDGRSSLRRELDDCPRIPLVEALSISLQIVHALEEAHEKGIVHRDLKPQNIKASLEGKVKVLDFGLAKAMDLAAGAPPSASQLAHSPTLTLGGTAMGTILGTAGYMAPEQARGGAVDKRADIWAFGVVLYEMLAGWRLFEGESAMDTLSAVMRQEIDFERLPPSTPRRVRDLLRRCLERNPKNRLHDIADARLELEEALARPEREMPAPVAAVPGGAAPGRGHSPWLFVAAALAAALIALVTLRPPWRAEETPQLRAHKLSWDLPPGLSLAPIEEESPLVAISPDGATLAAVLADGNGTLRLYVRALDTLETRVLAGTEGANEPFFSPDGRSIAFFADGQLKRVAVAGGAVAKVADAPDSRGATWLEDGSILFTPEVDSGLVVAGENGGALRTVTQVDSAAGERSHRWPQGLPGGKSAIFTVGSMASPDFYDDASIDSVELATGRRTRILERASLARYVPAAGALVFARGGAMHALPFDPTTLAREGEPTTVLDGVATDVTTGALHASFSADGTLVYVSADPQAGESRLGWLSADGRVEPLAAPARAYWSWSLSPDGTKLVALISTRVSGELWLYDLARNVFSRLSVNEACFDPIWTPDGQAVVYSRMAAGGAEIVRRPAQGGEPEILHKRPESGDYLYVRSITADGNRLIFESQSAGSKSDVFELRLDRPGEVRPVIQSVYDEYYPSISPDGRFIAYVSQESGRGEVYLRALDGSNQRWQVSNGGGAQPIWSRDGRTIFFRTSTVLARVDLRLEPRVELGPERTVVGVQLGNRRSVFGYALGPDGRFLISLASVTGSPPQLVVVLEFAAELKRRLVAIAH